MGKLGNLENGKLGRGPLCEKVPSTKQFRGTPLGNIFSVIQFIVRCSNTKTVPKQNLPNTAIPRKIVISY